MSEIWTMGELLVEVMRPRPGMGLEAPNAFLGPFPSGAPGIFIDTAARLGRSASIIGGVGDDDFGRCLLERLRRDGVATNLVQVFPEKSTGVAFVAYLEDGSRRFIFHWDGTPAVMAQVPDSTHIGAPKFFHVMGCSLMANEAFRQRVFEALEVFVAKGARISFDPNIRSELLREGSVDDLLGPVLRHCSVLLPGEAELAMLSGETDMDLGASCLFERYPLDIIALKRGRKGCRVYRAQETPLDVPAFPVTEVDPTGAGDCFDAGFVCGLIEGRSIEECARLASACGALNAQAFGPMEGSISPATVSELMQCSKAASPGASF